MLSDTQQDTAVSDTGAADTGDTQEKPGADTATEVIDWEARAKRAEADAEKHKALSRKHESRAKENAEAATKAKTVEQQLEDLRKQIAERDDRDAESRVAMAVTKLEARLTGAGFTDSDVAEVLEVINPQQLLADGKPDDKAIEKVAARFVKFGGRTTPDADQGQKGGGKPPDMNSIIRRAAGVVS